MVALTLLALGMFALMGSVSSAITKYAESDETRIATQAIANQIELMQTQVNALTDANVAAFLATTTFTVTDLPMRSNGSAASGAIRFLSESEAQSYWQAGSTGVDLDQDGTPNSPNSPSTTKAQKLYAVRLTVTWGDRTQKNTDRSLDVYTILFNRDG